ncbi:DUF86 domain-containing protein [Desulfosarcina widdelii]|uniref:DUF86 domain-containing protein n=1 Tax=Desulfosarcina widdelii TaxID=947919 RepID=A0A5K7YYM3_9BACT|nr:DUF86 domain-containing protein [Desulfosarcina widdelii]BBO73139.1 DUF86 domain-containing protein [Desulfosarcina widdelii]
MPHRRWDIRIHDILASIEKIQKYTDNMDAKAFRDDPKTVDAVVRNLEIIGEAARHVPDEIVEEHHKIPWREMRDMRNLLSHEYFGVNSDIVWETIQSDLPGLPALLKAILP